MSHMDRIRAEHDLAVMESRRQFEIEQERNEQAIFDAVAACQALQSVPPWKLREQFEALREALYFIEHAIEISEGNIQ